MSSNVPLGAEYDSFAPWNQPDHTLRTCPCCGGTGHQYFAYNIRTQRTKECTQEEYDTLPEEDTQDALWVKDGSDICEQCNGDGEIEIENLYDPDDYFEE